MVKKQKPSKAARASKSDEIRIKSKFLQTSAVNTATLVNSLGNIGTASGTGILANDVNIQSLTDMFRLYRINSITFEIQPASGTSTAAVQIPAGALAFVPFGNATTPTSMQDFETPLISDPSVSFATAAATAPLTKECGTRLSLKNSDMPVLQGPGDGWLATQDDGTQGYFGKLFWTLASVTAANTLNYLLTTHFDISFKDLLDPSLISKNMAMRHPNGIPAHWNVPDDHPLNQLSMVVRACNAPSDTDQEGPDFSQLNRRRIMRKPAGTDPSPAPSPWWRG